MTRITLLILAYIFLLFSCTDKIYKHKEVVKTFQTPAELTARMGAPSEIKVVGNQKEYLYYYVIKSNKIKHKILDITDPLSKQHRRAFMDSLGIAIKYYDSENKPMSFNDNQLDRFDYWIKFTYSEDGKFVKTEQKGVDLSVKVHRPVNTIILIVLTTALVGFSISFATSPILIGPLNLHF